MLYVYLTLLHHLLPRVELLCVVSTLVGGSRLLTVRTPTERVWWWLGISVRGSSGRVGTISSARQQKGYYPWDSDCVLASAAAVLCDAGRSARVYSGGGLVELLADISCELTVCDPSPVQSIRYNVALLPSAVPFVPRARQAMLTLTAGFSTLFSSGLASCQFSRDREEKLLVWNQTTGSAAEWDRISRCGGLWCLQCGCGQTVVKPLLLLAFMHLAKRVLRCHCTLRWRGSPHCNLLCQLLSASC